MGESTTFRCEDCGYHSGPIRWGVSVRDPRCRYMPALCGKCRAYVEIDLTGADILVDEFKCAECGSEVVFIKRADVYTCPHCGGGRITLKQGPTYW